MPGGRPKAKIDMAEVEKLAQLQCTDVEIAAFLGVTTRTIENYRAKDATFREAMERGKAKGLISLRRAQYQEALKGNPTMLVWLGKALLGQKDKIASELSGPDGSAISIDDKGRTDLVSSVIKMLEKSKTEEK
jgi:hypothetical protein